MKKILSLILCLALCVGCLAIVGCGGKTEIPDDCVAEDGTYEVAVVTDVGQLKDKGFNEGTWTGAKTYAYNNGKDYKYYQPQGGSDASDNDRIAAMKAAIDNGAEIIVAPGFLQAAAMTAVATEYPDVKFVFIDGWALGLDNVTAVSYKEQESGYMAGYAAVMEGYTKLGGTFGGGGTNPACNRFGYGYIQGAEAAAIEKNVEVEIKYSYQYGSTFSASSELQTQIAGWYQAGTEVVFACGGSMFDSVKSAAAEYQNAKIIGVDVDQSGESSKVITSAVKGLAASVEKVLGQFYAGEWDTVLANKTQNLGAADDATGLPTETWSMKNFKKAQYEDLYAKIKAGEIVPKADVADVVDSAAVLTANLTLTKVTVLYE